MVREWVSRPRSAHRLQPDDRAVDPPISRPFLCRGDAALHGPGTWPSCSGMRRPGDKAAAGESRQTLPGHRSPARKGPIDGSDLAAIAGVRERRHRDQKRRLLAPRAAAERNGLSAPNGEVTPVADHRPACWKWPFCRSSRSPGWVGCQPISSRVSSLEAGLSRAQGCHEVPGCVPRDGLHGQADPAEDGLGDGADAGTPSSAIACSAGQPRWCICTARRNRCTASNDARAGQRVTVAEVARDAVVGVHLDQGRQEPVIPVAVHRGGQPQHAERTPRRRSAVPCPADLRPPANLRRSRAQPVPVRGYPPQATPSVPEAMTSGPPRTGRCVAERLDGAAIRLGRDLKSHRRTPGRA